MKIVAIKDMSAGNDTVGDMWKETEIFDADEPIINIIKWAYDRKDKDNDKAFGIGFRTKCNIIITVPEIKE